MKQKISIRPFEDTDRQLMVTWLYQDYVKKWLIHPENWLAEIDQRHDKFNWVHHYIVMLGDQPIGFCQYYDCYQAKDLEEWTEVQEPNKIFSIDYLIGEAEYIGQGYGKQIVQELVQIIQQQEKEAEEIIVEPDPQNFASIEVLEANGFVFDRYYRKKL
ncbi:GNAT family N-acetyltransferase [Enterococcus sp. 669A]|uniref:GNAT family N-acetyltransferase n=1 Tax=Candidatus Enterococcus moelleringii TaxID=2815325 RepID=A0ABS3LCA5_9ENTE|nr:GNAT family N-acetyltransferase [Enterococcus sp. 669A]MBO1307265.1 GNAT family N-acetyltransferase [Enterococcus sp. 669A]